jgi:hypothetical protein
MDTNVKRMAIDLIKERLRLLANLHLFDFNDHDTREMIYGKVKGFISNLPDVLIPQDSLVVCDASNNTPEVIAENQFVVDVYLKWEDDPNFKVLRCETTQTAVDVREAIVGVA